MSQSNHALAYKYDVSEVLNALQNIPQTFNGYLIDPDTVVDIFIMTTLNSFQVCSFYPEPPIIQDPGVRDWCQSNQLAQSMLYKLIKVPPQCSGWEATYIRYDHTVWIHYLFKGNLPT